VNYDDETLMAYADGELDETQRAQITAAMAQDPELARRVQRQRALRAEVAGAFASVIDQPLPERLVVAARGDGAESAHRPPRRAEVVQFPGRTATPVANPWGGRQWAAMAASLVLGVLISWQLFTPPEPLMTASHGALVARGALAGALEQQRASTQRDTDLVQIGITFRMQDGRYCRSFALRAAGTAGLACHVEGEWQLAATAAAAGSEGDVRPAASPPPAVLQAIESRISGEPLDAAGEEQALRNSWNPGGP
jgi:anti-sigma factor RsiW